MASSPARATAPRPTAPARSTPASRPALTLLARPEPDRSRFPLVLTCTVILVGTLATLLWLNIQMSDASYQITRLQIQSQQLTEQSQALQEENDRLGTPQELERSARELGMVPGADPAYIDVATGEVLGEASAVEAPAPAVLVPAEEAQ